jgi:hypothetical protein
MPIAKRMQLAHAGDNQCGERADCRSKAITRPHRQKRLAPAQAWRDHYVVTAAASNRDCRAVLFQIVAPYRLSDRL